MARCTPSVAIGTARSGLDLESSSVIMVPQLVGALDGVFITAVSAGDHHSLFLSDRGRVYSCGWARYGVLGYSLEGQQALPKMIEALATTKIVSISAGSSSLVGGRLWLLFEFVWVCSAQVCVIFAVIPPPLPQCAGELIILAVSAEGVLYSFGCKDHGKLGLGEEDRGVSLPNKFPPSHTKRFRHTPLAFLSDITRPFVLSLRW